MKKTKTLSEQVQSILKSNIPLEENPTDGQEFIDFNKSIEKMLTSQTRKVEKNKKVQNILNP